MDLGVAILLGATFPAGVAGLWSVWSSRSYFHAFLSGAFVAAATMVLLALLCLAALVFWYGLLPHSGSFYLGLWLVPFCAALAAPAGAAAGVVGRLVSLAAFPVGPDRRRGDSLVYVSERLGGDMTLKKALLIIVGLTAVSGALGCLGGFLLGTFNPGYYRGVFGAGDRPDFDPVAVGMGLGLSQWAAGGLAVGVVLVVVLTWYDLRCRQIASGAASRRGTPDRRDGDARITNAPAVAPGDRGGSR